MTSPLRRKHQTTALKSRPKTAANARRSSFWRILFDHVSQSCRIGLLAGVALSSTCQISWADDFRHAGRLGRTEPARLQISDDARPLNRHDEDADLGTPPSEAEEEIPAGGRTSSVKIVADQSNAWRLRWRQPAVQNQNQAPTPTVVSRSTLNQPKLASASKLPSASKAVLEWSESETREPSHVRQVAQFSPADPFHDPFGDDSQGKVEEVAAPTEMTEISQPGQSQPGGGSQPSGGLPGGLGQPGGATQPGGAAQPGGIDPSPFPGTQLQPNDNRLLPGGNRPVPPTNFPTPNSNSPFPAEDRPGTTDDRPLIGDDRPLQPETPAPAETQPRQPDFPPDFTDPAPAPKDTEGLETPSKPGEEKEPCERTYNKRNCCTENNKCNIARDKIRAYTISRIPLDISPSFTNTDPKISTEVFMEKTLAEAPSRTWLDREGKQLAQGRIHDFRNGRVHVATDSGEVVKIPFQHLSDDDLCFFTAWWSIPTECPLADDEFIPRNWICSNLDWKASGLCHKPLYFEEVALERYGHTTGPFTQPFVSTAHFFGSLVTLPYQMGMHPPQECQYVLGYYRPGNCAPWLFPPFPVSVRGGVAQAAAVVGGIYVIP